MDNLSPKRRSANMRAIRSNDTAPERIVRRLVPGMGCRFRLHQSTLPGKPDLVFAGKRKVMFVHGCFWHQHKKCREGRHPRSNKKYWVPKLSENVQRDNRHLKALRRDGWSVLMIWECQVTNDKILRLRLKH